jgi:hypothetical protein
MNVKTKGNSGKAVDKKSVLIIGIIMLFFIAGAYFYSSSLSGTGPAEVPNQTASPNSTASEPKVPQGDTSNPEMPDNEPANNQTNSNRNESFGALQIISDPPGAAVFIDSVAYGATPLAYNLSAGTHILALNKPGYHTYKAQVLIKQGEASFLNVSMAQTVPTNTTPNASVQTGTLSIHSNPSKATIRIDNETIGANTLTPAVYSNITADYHTISFEKSGYLSYSTKVYVAPGIVTQVDANLTATDAQFGTLNITTSPEAAEFYLDGQLVGTTPIVYNATVDYHFVRLEKAGYIDYNKRVYTNANKVIDMNVTLQAQE